MTEPNRTRIYRRLHEGARVGLRAEACLPLRSRYAECDRCVTSCPVGVLHRSETGFALDDGCLGCGRCAAACAMGALGVAGFDIGSVHAAEGETLCVDCWRVPVESSPKNAVRVPCLGGLSVGQLLGLHLAAGVRPLVLLDRGWCEQCPAGGGEAHPIEASLALACQSLRDVGVAAADLPHIERRHRPIREAEAGIPEPESMQTLSRRDFFNSFARQITASTSSLAFELADAEPQQQTGAQRYAPATSPERERRVLALRQVAVRTGRALPGRLFPKLALADTCRNHRVCAFVCPTGALSGYQEKEGSGLVYNAADCIGCAQCERACPEQALGFSEDAGEAVEESIVLTRHTERSCGECGADFTPVGEEDLCLPCRRSREFARTAAALFVRRGLD